MPSRTSLLRVLYTLAAVALLLAPAVAVFALGWISIKSPDASPSGEETRIEAWVALAVFYVFWASLVLAGLVVVLDRLDFKYMPVERPPLESRRQKRRRKAGLDYLRAQQEAARREAADEAAKKRDRPDDAEGPDQRGAA